MLLGSERDVQMDLWKYFCYNIHKKQLRLPSSTRRQAAPRWLHARPTQQRYDLPAIERAPMNDSASGGPPGKGLLAPWGGR